MFLPSVIEKTGRSNRHIDLPSRLLQDRIIYLGGPIDSDIANVVIMQMLWLNADNKDEPINLYINSPGGSVYDGLAIKDIMYSISAKVNTTGIGMCASMGAYLLSAGTGERSATENCRVMLHSVSSGNQGTFHDLEIDFNETKHLQDVMMEDLTSFVKGSIDIETMRKLTQRDYYMSAQTALDYGFIDRVI